MTRIRVMGPKSDNSGPVSYRRCCGVDANGSVTNNVLVTIKLGEQLRQVGQNEKETGEKEEMAREESTTSHEQTGHLPPAARQQTTNDDGGDYDVQKDTRKEPTQQDHSDSDSELEVLEVRVLPPRRAIDTDDESDLSSLDEELNQALSSTTTMPTQPVTSPKKEPEPVSKPYHPPIPMHKLLPTLYKPVKLRSTPAPPGYRQIPPNLVCAIQRELNMFFDTGDNDKDALEVVNKVIFSLKDPYSATKIKLPVKATTCRHFECFDLDNFCTFSKMPSGIRHTLRKSLVQKSHDARRLEQLFLKQQKLIAEGALSFKAPGLVYPSFSEHGQMFFSEVYSRTPPLYKCPLCDEKFGLKQLYISDIFNFLVKTTPRSVTRIELVETDKYKIIDEDTPAQDEKTATPDVVVLSEDESDEGEVKKEKTAPANKSFSAEEFNDGLDDMLTHLSPEDGTWNNPVTL
ncbi:hypothetical protein ACI3LY_001361 [Candidozyma auris]|uniref:SP-RING-type domain-containing protein n=2 Tax=Candidozyma auris TaxID=498019 RepID=A0A8F3AJ76_CANAR|nr:hypothetical protein QG37_04178 [[Candida] auris]QWW25422.1 hypothetical protein CA7LBN_004309 [[Candida] auris]